MNSLNSFNMPNHPSLIAHKPRLTIGKNGQG
jgi:hypothetical protein